MVFALWAQLAMASGWQSSTTFAGLDSKTQNVYDWYMCKSQAVFLGTVEGSTCIDGRETFDIRVERTYKGTLSEVVQAASHGCKDTKTYVSSEGMVLQSIYNPSAPVVIAKRAVFFLNADAGAEAPLTMGFPDAYLIPVEDDHDTFARISTLEYPTYVIDLSTIPIRRVTEYDLAAPGVPPTTENRAAPTASNRSAESNHSLVEADAHAIATPWSTVLDQLEVVASRQPSQGCDPATVRP